MADTSTEQERAGRYTKKPVTIEAVQWFKHGDHPDVRQVADSDHLYFTGMGGATLEYAHLYGVVGTLESPNHLVTPGDWIIRGVKGELYPCKPDVFAATYEPEQAARRAPVVPWQPIETASKQPTLLLGFFNENGKWRTTRGCWFSKKDIEDTWEDDEIPEGWYETPVESEHCYYIEPTHWMPLPQPPESAK